MKFYKIFHVIGIAVLLFSTACSDDLTKDGPIRGKDLANDCLFRTLGPLIVGTEMEFVYAMAIPRDKGKIVSASVEVTIAGAEGTYMEHRSAYTSATGQDAWVTIGNPCVTTGGKTEVTFTRDTCAAALRYYYQIPPEAKGKQVKFTFTAKASTGESLSYPMGAYNISNMDMKLRLDVSDGENCYISIADMAVYNASEAASNGSKIDLVYLYRIMNVVEGTATQNAFGHAFVAPACDAQFRPDVTLPSGVSNNTLIRKVYALRDRHLADLQYGVYVDDIDFPAIKFENMPNYAIRMANEYGMWVETQDRKYRAYIYINSINNSAGSAVISMKRYAMN